MQEEYIKNNGTDSLWGINTGILVVHPLTSDLLPLYIASFVIKDQGEEFNPIENPKPQMYAKTDTNKLGRYSNSRNTKSSPPIQPG